MIDLNINVFCNVSKSGITEILQTVTFYNNIKVKFCDMFDDALGYCLLISDNPQEASSFRSGTSSKSKLYSVYYGDLKGMENRVDTVDDVWPDTENLNVTVARYKKIIAFIKANYDAWFFHNLYVTALDSIPEMAWCKDLKGRHYFVNDAFADTVHKSKKDCEGKDHYYIWNVKKEDHTDGELVCVDSEELVLKEQRTLMLDETLATSDGMMKLVTYKSPVFNEFGEIMGTVGVAHDVTDLINAQRDKDLLVESVPFPVVVVDANWKTKVVNGTMRRLLRLEGPAEKFDYLTWKKYFLTPKTEKVVDEEHHFTNQIFSANDNMVNFDFQINEQDIIDVFGNVTGHIIIPRKLGPNGEMLGISPVEKK
jgi:PAS domain S-box-containing protein